MKIRVHPLHMSRQEFFVRRLLNTPAPHLLFSFLSIIFSIAIVGNFEPALMVWLVKIVTYDWALFGLLLAILLLFSIGLPTGELAGMSTVSLILIMLATAISSYSFNDPSLNDSLLTVYPLKIALFLSFFWQAAYFLSATTKAIDWATSPLFAALNRHTKQAVSRLLPTKTTPTHGG